MSSGAHKKPFFLVLLAGLISLGGPARTPAADAPPLVLEHLTTADGLPQGTVYTTLQDSQGFLWLGTEDGLVRYDGHELVRYAHSRDVPNSLPANFVYQIVEDSAGDLWIALKDAGVARWNRASDSFTSFRHDPQKPDSLSSDAARSLAVDHDGRIWIGTSDAGLNVIERQSPGMTHLRHDARDPNSVMDDHIASLTVDRRGQVWIGTAVGLDRWDPPQRAFTHPLAATPQGHTVLQVREDRSGSMWVATLDGGLGEWDADGKNVHTFRHRVGEPGSIASDDVRALLEDQSGRLWVGTADGLDLLDRVSGQFSHYRPDVREPASLQDADIMSLSEDRTGLLWIGTRSAGVSRWNPRSWELGGHRPDWLAGKPVTAFAAGDAHHVWIGSLGGGLMQLNLDTGAAVSLAEVLKRHDPIGDNRVMSLLKDRRGNLWIGTMAAGLFELEPSGQVRTFPVRSGDPHAISAAGIMTLFEASSGAIWIGTHGGGANVLDPTSGRVRQLPYAAGAPDSIGFADVSVFAEDSRGNLWIGTDGGGLVLAQPDGRAVRRFRHDPNDRDSLPTNTVFALAVDSHDHVWVGTDSGGLVEVVGSVRTSQDLRFRSLTRSQGLTSDTVYGVVPDQQGSLWLSGNAGLARYEPASGALKTFHRQHGLQGEEFDFNASLRLPDGRLCFGGPGGFNIFDPTRLTHNNAPPRLALTRVSVMGETLVTPRPAWQLRHIDLSYRANVVSLDFAALDFTAPKTNRLAYRMGGLTDNWIDLGAQHRVTLTNLESGDHLLEIRGASAEAPWSEQPLRISLHRDPPPWRSWWAYSAYVVLLVGFIAYQIRAQREKFHRVLAEQRRLEESARALTERVVQVRTLVNALPDQLWVVDEAGRIQWSPQAEAESAAEEVPELAPRQTLAQVLHAVSQTAADGRQRKLEYQSNESEQGARSYEMRFTRRESGDVVVTRQDTTERTAAAAHIERLAYVDTLTGLPNRQRCLDTAARIFAEAALGSEQVAVLYLDLNNFKRVNDTLGHSIGDAVLRTASVRLEQVMETVRLSLPHASISRVGGDEFVALLRNPRGDVSTMEVARTLSAAFEAPITQNSLDFYCGLSIGIATFPLDGGDVMTVFKHADTAMYHAKGSGSGSIAVYSPAMSSRLRDWLDLESRLRHAVQNGKLRLHFQPKFRVRDACLVGVEALLRWHDPEHGEISPARFIEIAEDSGLIIEIGGWVAWEACRHLRRWRDAGYAVPIAINVSAKELLYADPAAVVEQAAGAAGVPASLIEVEITESLLVQDSTAVQGALQRLRQLGCRIALDDFGTGYSSLAYITRFPPDRIKIDKAFVREVDRSASDAAVASAILSLGANLNVTVTAEGVERPGQLEWLRARGCDEVQGFLLSKPVPAGEMEALLRSRAQGTSTSGPTLSATALQSAAYGRS